MQKKCTTINSSDGALTAQNSSNIVALTDSYEVPLIAGQCIDAGTVTVRNDAEYVYVTYNTNAGWKIKEAHVKIENADTYLVSSNKEIAPGSFPYSKLFTSILNINLLPQSHTFVIPRSSLNYPNAAIYAHAAVVSIAGRNETAWGGNIQNNDGIKWYGEAEYNITENVITNTIEDASGQMSK